MKYFCPILDKKDPSEDKELPDPSGPLSKVIPSSSIASCNAEITKVTKNSYTKLTLVQRYEIGKKGAEMGVTAAIRGSHTQLWSQKMNTFLNPRDHMIIPQ